MTRPKPPQAPRLTGATVRLKKYWVFKAQLMEVDDPDLLIDVNTDERLEHVYKAADVLALLRRMEGRR